MNKKYNLLIPMAGLGKRFSDVGYYLPKPLLTVGDRQILDWSMDSLSSEWKEEANLVFVVREEHVANFGIDEILRAKYGLDVQIVVQPTSAGRQGAVHSCYLAAPFLIPELPLFVYCLDVHFTPTINLGEVKWEGADGFVLVFKANNPAYSYYQVDEQKRVVDVAEKKVISDLAASGLYGFRTAQLFVKYAEKTMAAGDEYKVNGEWYISPMYKLLVDDGLMVRTKLVGSQYVIGTPEEVEFFLQAIYPRLNPLDRNKPIAVCSDHSGRKSKDKFITLLQKRNIPYIDFGTYTKRDVDYPDFVRPAAESVLRGHCQFGVTFCKSGEGPMIYANKIQGIRAALIYSERSAASSIQDNAANFFSIPEALIDEDRVLLPAVLDHLMCQVFSGGRHSDRVREILKVDNRQH